MIKVAFKPTSTIAREQNTVSRDGEDVAFTARGRHDPCVVPRAVPMVEAMVALVLADQLLQVLPQVCLLLISTAHCTAHQHQHACMAELDSGVLRAQHYAQCELLPRGDGCSPDTRVAAQFSHSNGARVLAPAM